MREYAWPPPYLEQYQAAVRADTAPAALLPPFVFADEANWVTGPAKRSRKSLFLFEAVRCIATGKSGAHGMMVPVIKDGVRCLVLEKEGARKGTSARWDKLAQGDGWDCKPGMIRFAHRYPILLTSAKSQIQLFNLIHDEGIKFVLIDTFAKHMHGDENSSDDIGRVMEAVDAMREAGASVSYIDHVHKPREEKEDVDDEGRGSSAKAGYYDRHLAFREENKQLILTVREREGGEALYRVNWEFSDTEENPSTSVALERFELDAEPPTSVVTACFEALELNTVYTLSSLGRLWSTPGEITYRILEVLITADMVKRTARGFRLAGGNTK